MSVVDDVRERARETTAAGMLRALVSAVGALLTQQPPSPPPPPAIAPAEREEGPCPHDDLLD